MTIFQQLAVKFSRKGYCFLSAQGITQASVGLDCDEEEASGGRKKAGLLVLRGHHSILGQYQAFRDPLGSSTPQDSCIPGSGWDEACR